MPAGYPASIGLRIAGWPDLGGQIQASTTPGRAKLVGRFSHQLDQNSIDFLKFWIFENLPGQTFTHVLEPYLLCSEGSHITVDVAVSLELRPA
jgi:hypothetical protein